MAVLGSVRYKSRGTNPHSPVHAGVVRGCNNAAGHVPIRHARESLAFTVVSVRPVKPYQKRFCPLNTGGDSGRLQTFGILGRVSALILVLGAEATQKTMIWRRSDLAASWSGSPA